MEYEAGISVSKLAVDNKLNRSTIYYWIDTLLSKPIEEILISKSEYKRLEIKSKRIKDEHAIFKSLLEEIDLTSKEKVEHAKRLHSQDYPIHMICRLLNLRRSTFYYHITEKPEVKQIDVDDEKYKLIITQIFTNTEGRLGARKIRIIMMKKGYQISERRVKRLLNEMNLIPNKPYDDYNNYHKRKYSFKPSIIKKSEHYPEPNRIWVSDITLIKNNGLRLYFLVLIDLYSRKVIGYYLGESVETKDLIRLMNSTYKKRKEPNNLIFHSEQGTQYRSFDFKNYLKSKNIKQSFSRKACPYDNSVCESFFSRLKKEKIYRHLFNRKKI